MERKGFVKKIVGGILAVGMVAAIGIGTSSTASAAGFDHDRGRGFVAERHDYRFDRDRDDHFRRDRFVFGGGYFYGRDRCR